MLNKEKILSGGIAENNLFEISAEQARLNELRICELSILADLSLDYMSSLLNESSLELHEAVAMLSEQLSGINSTLSDIGHILPENLKRLEFFGRITETADRAMLSELICERAASVGIDINEESLLYTEGGEATFTYLKNAYSDEAYEVFCEDITDAKIVKYSAGLKEAARLVADGTATFCLLPLEEMGVRIAAVSNLIAKHDLKINRVTSVFGFDGTADMKYAMLSLGYTVPTRDVLDDRYLEIRHPIDSQPELCDLILAASSFGHRVYRINTCTLNDAGERKTYNSLVFRDDDGDFSAMLTYLSLFSPDTSVVGIYKNLE